jgi:hypothetical protein
VLEKREVEVTFIVKRGLCRRRKRGVAGKESRNEVVNSTAGQAPFALQIKLSRARRECLCTIIPDTSYDNSNVRLFPVPHVQTCQPI